jgi:hypothetical protein
MKRQKKAAVVREGFMKSGLLKEVSFGKILEPMSFCVKSINKRVFPVHLG